ncbi:hypothetical protein Naga_100252g6 [Nannochloropsis gaditana]|uniref:Uncharacterized protein n=1 Tax=Nannochloropsis gaditana TaxID=72520 RepID=W7T0T1_9STRA|nr:hypothetical protein Naga_100252g6 [Nannochloropsis gaditana]
MDPTDSRRPVSLVVVDQSLVILVRDSWVNRLVYILRETSTCTEERIRVNDPVVLPVYLSPISRVPFRYLNTRFAAIQSSVLAACKCFPNDCTANAISGRVTSAAYNKLSTSFMYSLSGLISLSFVFFSVPSIGVNTGLQSAIPNLLSTISI